MKKTMRKIIPAIVMLMISAMLVGTSTYAWFSMNNKVTVTGMTVRTKVGNNLAISSTSDADPTDNTDYRTTMVVSDINALLEPVSSINGLDSDGNRSFYWTSTTNVNASNGDALSEIYVNYDGTNGDDFNTNYGTGSAAVPYADYTIILKANNTDSANYLDITKLDLTYGGTDATGNDAFRAAVLVEKWNGSAWGTQTSKTVLKPSTAAYLTPSEAVNSTSTLASVANLGTAATIDNAVSNSGASYYRVVIRLWFKVKIPTANSIPLPT